MRSLRAAGSAKSTCYDLPRASLCAHKRRPNRTRSLEPPSRSARGGGRDCHGSPGFPDRRARGAGAGRAGLRRGRARPRGRGVLRHVIAGLRGHGACGGADRVAPRDAARRDRECGLAPERRPLRRVLAGAGRLPRPRRAGERSLPPCGDPAPCSPSPRGGGGPASSTSPSSRPARARPRLLPVSPRPAPREEPP